MIDVCGRITEAKNGFEISYGTERGSSSFVLASLLAWYSGA